MYVQIKKPYDDGVEKFDVGWQAGGCHIYDVVKPDYVLKNKAECDFYEKG